MLIQFIGCIKDLNPRKIFSFKPKKSLGQVNLIQALCHTHLPKEDRDLSILSICFSNREVEGGDRLPLSVTPAESGKEVNVTLGYDAVEWGEGHC